MPNIKKEGNFASALESRMQKKGVSVRDLSIQSGATYEHIRKLVRGLALPSPILLNVLCKALDWDEQEAKRMTAADAVQKRYGANLPKELSGVDPSLIPFKHVIPQLSKDDQDRLLIIARALRDARK